MLLLLQPFALDIHAPQISSPTDYAISRRYCPQITDDGLVALMRHCTNLTMLGCEGNTNITDASLYEIAMRLQPLEILLLTKCPHLTDHGMKSVLLSCKSLTKVSFGNSNILGEAFVTLSIPGTVMVEVQALRSLNLSGCVDLMDSGLTWIAKGCVSLREAIFKSCHQISDEGMTALLQINLNLEDLDLGGALNVDSLTDEQLHEKILSGLNFGLSSSSGGSSASN